MRDPGPIVASGPNLSGELARHLNAPADRMLTHAAARWPERTAVVDATGATTFGELEAAVDRLAHHLLERLGRDGRVVAISSVLSIDYVVAYYAVLRSGNVVASLNPLLPPPVIAHNLGMVDTELVLATAPVRANLAKVRDDLPTISDVLALEEIRTVGTAGAAPAVRPEKAPHSPACVLFTSGTTGAPKAISLSHRNITVNAAQVAQAHGLDERAVSAINLPTYHPMHLNPAVLTGATQVLCPTPDVTVSMAKAREHRATHYYSIPAWLIRLATGTELVEIDLPDLRLIASGGSALPPDAADLLSKHFGVPVFQGYGLAETSPLTHSDDPRRPLRGSVGYPVALTECVVVDLDTGQPRPAGQLGEVRVRGPQIMLGYLGDAPRSHVDGQGWLATGDIGLMEPDGRLVLLDRIKDVFKRDNWLVSPTAVEQRLRAHPAVVECVVVDYPDKFAGAVATGFVVLRPDFPAHRVDEITAFANTDAPGYEHVEFLEVVERIPRSANGKIQRRDLREEMVRRRMRGR